MQWLQYPPFRVIIAPFHPLPGSEDPLANRLVPSRTVPKRSRGAPSPRRLQHKHPLKELEQDLTKKTGNMGPWRLWWAACLGRMVEGSEVLPFFGAPAVCAPTRRGWRRRRGGRVACRASSGQASAHAEQLP